MKRSPWQIQKTVILALLLRELKTRFGAHRLGVIWLFLEPALQTALLMFIFSFMQKQALIGIEFPVFLLTGVMPFLMFKSIAMRLMNSLEGNKALFAYRHVTPMDTFVARAVLEALLYLAVFFILACGLIALGYRVELLRPLEFMSIIATLAGMGLGLGLILSVLADAVPAAKTFVGMAFMPLYLLSGIFFPLTIIPEQYREWLLWNPLLHAIELVRATFFVNYSVDNGISFAYIFSVTIVLMFVGLWLYRYRRLEMASS